MQALRPSLFLAVVHTAQCMPAAVFILCPVSVHAAYIATLYLCQICGFRVLHLQAPTDISSVQFHSHPPPLLQERAWPTRKTMGARGVKGF
jgi:hypothetical protein